MSYTIENYNNILKALKSLSSFPSNDFQRGRILGCIEAILVNEGKLTVGQELERKTIEYQTRNIFLKKVTKTRKQTYKELIVEMFIKLIEEKENGSK